MSTPFSSRPRAVSCVLGRRPVKAMASISAPGYWKGAKETLTDSGQLQRTQSLYNLQFFKIALKAFVVHSFSRSHGSPSPQINSFFPPLPFISLGQENRAQILSLIREGMISEQGEEDDLDLRTLCLSLNLIQNFPCFQNQANTAWSLAPAFHRRLQFPHPWFSGNPSAA